MPSGQILELRYFRWRPTICHALVLGCPRRKAPSSPAEEHGAATERGPDGGVKGPRPNSIPGPSVGSSGEQVCAGLGKAYKRTAFMQ
jgi:hypothetical protein